MYPMPEASLTFKNMDCTLEPITHSVSSTGTGTTSETKEEVFSTGA
jgi:hypothetical protein